MANDTWFRGLELKYGPDGGVYLTDWYDTGECHENDADNAHRENGRIYKITYGNAHAGEGRPGGHGRSRRWRGSSSTRTTGTSARPGGCSRNARPRAQDLGQAHRRAPRDPRDQSRRHPPAARPLGAVRDRRPGRDKPASALLDHPSEHVRAWAIRLLCDGSTPTASTVLTRFAELAKTDPSPKVRLSLASALQRIPVDRRWPIAEPLASHTRRRLGPMLPLMIWYGVEPLVPPIDRGRRRLGSALPDPARAPVRRAPGRVGRRRQPAWPRSSRCSKLADDHGLPRPA